MNGVNEIRPAKVLSSSPNQGREFSWRTLMSAYIHPTNAAACAFCAKPLPIVNGELQPWRAANGQFFCNEFCADDAEAASFQSHRRAGRRDNDLRAHAER
jgi:hypothetical protein